MPTFKAVFETKAVRFTPYLILFCWTKLSTDSIGFSIRFTVKNAERLALYVEIMSKMNSHQDSVTKREAKDLKHKIVLLLFI